jgi:hypothetical protein
MRGGFPDFYQLPMELSDMDKRHMGITTSKYKNKTDGQLVFYGCLSVFRKEGRYAFFIIGSFGNP